MIRLFQILAVVLAGAAAYFLWMGMKDPSFAAIVLGCVAFFLSFRFQVNARNDARQSETNQKNDPMDK